MVKHFYVIQTHTYTSQFFFAGVLWWLMHLHCLALNNIEAEQHYFGCFSQCSVIIKAGKHG